MRLGAFPQFISPRNKLKLNSILFGRNHLIKKAFIILSILTISGYQLQQAILNFSNALNGTPVITSMSATTGSTAAGDIITVTGQNFLAERGVKFRQVVSNSNHTTFAIDSDGHLWAWGENSNGQLGNNSIVASNIPINLSASVSLNGQPNVLYEKTFSQISNGTFHTLAIDSSGKMWAWGSNTSGQLGINNTSGTFSTPFSLVDPATFSGQPNVLQGKTFIQVIANTTSSLAIDSSGKLWAWGSNAYGQLGNNSVGPNISTPLNLSEPGMLNDATNELHEKTFSSVSLGWSHALAVDSSGQLWSWGRNEYGQLGNNSGGYNIVSPTPINLSEPDTLNSAANVLHGVTVSQAAISNNSSYIIDSSGQLWSWGQNSSGELGNNQISSWSAVNSTPINLSESDTLSNTTNVLYGKTFTKVSGGGNPHVRAIDSSGQLWSWGFSMALGNNDDTVDSATPINLSNEATLGGSVNVLYEKTFLDTGGGLSHAFAIDSSGQLWTWGFNNSGQLGDGSNTSSSTPLSITPAKIAPNITSVKFGERYAPSLTVVNDTQLIVETPQSSAGFVDVTYNYLSGEVVKANAFEFTLPTPSIDSLSETSGPVDGGEEITISGNNFMADQGVFAFVSVSTSSGHSLAIDISGQLWVWGENSNGQLGNGLLTSSLVPINLSAYRTEAANPVYGLSFSSVVAGDGHSLAIDSSGQLWAWGYNNNGQLGNSSTTRSTIPINLSAFSSSSPLYNTKFIRVAAGGYHSLAIDSSGQLWSWGSNSNYGQLGDGTTISSSTPINLSSFDPLHPLYGVLFDDISASVTAPYLPHNLAIDSTGQLWSWGYNGNGQLGNNSTTSSSIPINLSEEVSFNSETNILNGKTFAHIAAGGGHSLAIDSSGQLWSWGGNTYGQLGNNSTTSSSIPINLSEEVSFNGETNILNGKTFAHIAAGGGHSLAYDSSDQLWSWGNNSYGQLGDGTAVSSPTPINLSLLSLTIYDQPLSPLSFLSAGSSHTFAIDSSGLLLGWGLNSSGQLGNGTIVSSLTPISLSGSSVLNESTNILNDVSFIQIVTGDRHTLAIDHSGQLWSWGYNNYGQLGNSSITSSSTPINLSKPDTFGGAVNVLHNKTFKQVAAGNYSSFAIDSSGQLWAWGYNWYGQLGNNTSGGENSTPINLSAPAILNNKTNVLHGVLFSQIVASAYYYTLAIDSSGQLWAWGRGDSGQLGNNSTSGGGATPINLSAETTLNTLPNELFGKSFSRVAVGERHSLAIDSSGQLWSWGYNGSGQLGNNSTTSSSTPINLSSGASQLNGADNVLYGSTFKHISAGWDHSLAIDSSGQLWSWGQNGTYQLGNVSTTNTSTPVNLSSFRSTHPFYGKTFASTASAGGLSGSHNLAIDSSGQLWSWGGNAGGQLGTNSTGNVATPVNLSESVNLSGSANALNGRRFIAAATSGSSTGVGYTLVIDSSGQIWSFGGNANGQLGINGVFFYTPKATRPSGFISSISSINFGTNETSEFTVTSTGEIRVIVPPSLRGGAVDVTITIFDGQVATLANGYTYISPDFIDVSLDTSNLSVPITPTASGSFSSRKQTLSFTTNMPSGVSVTMQTAGTSSSLSNSAGTANIPSTSNTILSADELLNNTWGFAIPSGSISVPNDFSASYTEETSVATSSAKFASVPASNDAELLIKTTSAPNPDTANTTDIYYGTRVNMDMPSGTYRVEVVYTVIANP